LSWKTPKETQADRVAHGAATRRERSGTAKLSSAEVAEVKALKGCEKQRVTAKRFGVNQSTISPIQRGIRGHMGGCTADKGEQRPA
jgi:hypothetical protein